MERMENSLERYMKQLYQDLKEDYCILLISNSQSLKRFKIILQSKQVNLSYFVKLKRQNKQIFKHQYYQWGIPDDIPQLNYFLSVNYLIQCQQLLHKYNQKLNETKMNIFSRNSNSTGNIFSGNTNNYSNTPNNSYGNSSYGNNSYQSNTSYGGQGYQYSTDKIGTKRVNSYNPGQISSQLISFCPQWKQIVPMSINLRQETLHLNLVQQRLQDYYLIRKNQLRNDKYERGLKQCIDQKTFNPELLNKGLPNLKLLPYTADPPIEINSRGNSYGNTSTYGTSNYGNSSYGQNQTSYGQTPTGANIFQSNSTGNNIFGNSGNTQQSNNPFGTSGGNSINTRSSNNIFGNSNTPTGGNIFSNNTNTANNPFGNSGGNNINTRSSNNIFGNSNSNTPSGGNIFSNNANANTGNNPFNNTGGNNMNMSTRGTNNIFGNSNTSGGNIFSNNNSNMGGNNIFANSGGGGNNIFNNSGNNMNNRSNNIFGNNNSTGGNIFSNNNTMGNNLFNNTGGNNMNPFNTNMSYSYPSNTNLFTGNMGMMGQSLPNTMMPQFMGDIDAYSMHLKQQLLMAELYKSQKLQEENRKRALKKQKQWWEVENDQDWDITAFLKKEKKNRPEIIMLKVDQNFERRKQKKLQNKTKMNFQSNNFMKANSRYLGQEFYSNAKTLRDEDNSQIKDTIFAQHKIQYQIKIIWRQQPALVKTIKGELTEIDFQLENRALLKKNIMEDINQKFPNYFKKHIVFEIDQPKQYRKSTKVNGFLTLAKINIPHQYSYSPLYFEGFQVKNLKIQNDRYGKVVWPNKINVQFIDFSKAIEIGPTVFDCHEPALENQTSQITFYSFPKDVQKYVEQRNYEKAMKKLQKIIDKIPQAKLMYQPNFQEGRWCVELQKTPTYCEDIQRQLNNNQ